MKNGQKTEEEILTCLDAALVMILIDIIAERGTGESGCPIKQNEIQGRLERDYGQRISRRFLVGLLKGLERNMVIERNVCRRTVFYKIAEEVNIGRVKAIADAPFALGPLDVEWGIGTIRRYLREYHEVEISEEDLHYRLCKMFCEELDEQELPETEEEGD